MLEVKQIKERIESPEFVKKFSAAIASDTNAQKELSFAMQLLAGDEKLRDCSMESILRSVYNVANTGLTLNPILRHATLIARWTKGGMECTLMPMYQGLANLIVKAGVVRNITSYTVNEGDEFEVTLGTEVEVHHRPKFKSRKITHAYAVATLDDGSRQIEVMTLAELHEHRDASDSWKAYMAQKMKAENVIWLKWESEMCRKTVLRRLLKYLPKSKSEELVNTLAIEEANYPASAGAIGYAESLLATSSYDSEQRAIIEDKLCDTDLTSAECGRITEDLKQNQATKKLK